MGLWERQRRARQRRLSGGLDPAAHRAPADVGGGAAFRASRDPLQTFGNGMGPSPAQGIGASPFPEPPGVGHFQFPPPSVYPPPAATSFRAQGNNAATVLADLEVTLGTFQVPQGYEGVIRHVEFDVNSLLLTSDIVFRVRVAGATPQGWRYPVFPTAAAFFAFTSPPESTMIWVTEGALVEVTAQVFDAGTYTLGGDLQGWFYSVATADAYEDAFGRLR